MMVYYKICWMDSRQMEGFQGCHSRPRLKTSRTGSGEVTACHSHLRLRIMGTGFGKAKACHSREGGNPDDV